MVKFVCCDSSGGRHATAVGSVWQHTHWVYGVRYSWHVFVEVLMCVMTTEWDFGKLAGAY